MRDAIEVTTDSPHAILQNLLADCAAGRVSLREYLQAHYRDEVNRKIRNGTSDANARSETICLLLNQNFQEKVQQIFKGLADGGDPFICHVLARAFVNRLHNAGYAAHIIRDDQATFVFTEREIFNPMMAWTIFCANQAKIETPSKLASQTRRTAPR